MRNKEDMDCFKWHKNDRICYVCDHEEECKFELAVHSYAGQLYFKCQYRETFTDSINPKCKRPDREGNCCYRLNQTIVYECYAKEIQKFKRKYKLEQIENS